MSDAECIERMVASISPLLAGNPPRAQGAALADLLATWLAGHIILGDPRETDALRERLLISHIKYVRALTAINAAEIHGDKRQ